MIASVYARKSNPEEDKEHTEKSVERQKAEGRAESEAQGWTVADAQVYEDDVITGDLGIEHRPGLRALLDAAERTPRPFDVVVMARDDRLMRNQWELPRAVTPLQGGGETLLL